MTGTIDLGSGLRLYPPMLPPVSFPWWYIILALIPILLIRGMRWFTRQMKQRLEPVSHEEPPVELFDLTQRKKQVQQLNKEILTPEEKVTRLFLLLERYIIHHYPEFVQLPTYEELRAHKEVPRVIHDVVQEVYTYLYAEQHVTHGDIKQLTDRLLKGLF